MVAPSDSGKAKAIRRGTPRPIEEQASLRRPGASPAEVENLLQIVSLKRACRDANVEKLEAGPKGMTFAFRANKFANPAGLAAWLGSTKGRIKLRPDHKLALVADLSVPERVRLAKEVLGNLSRVATQAKAA